MDLYRDLLALNQYPDATPAGHINCEPEGTSYEKEENQSTVHQMIRTAPHDPLVYCAEYGVSGEDIDALGTMRITDHEEGSTNMGGKSCEVSHVTATSTSTINSSTNFPMTCFSSDPKFSSESSQGELHAWVDEQEGVKLPQFTLQNLEKHTETHPVSLSSQKSDSYASCSLNSSTKVDSSVLSQQSNAKKTIRRSIGLGLTAQDRGNPCNRIVCIPHHKIVTTQGSLRYKEDLRCICMNYLAGVCREGEQCMSLHADREYIARTRTPRGPLCCAAHNDVFSREVASVLSGTAYKLRGTNGELYDVDSNFLCITESLPVAPNSVFIIEMSSICRKHMQGQCKYSKECRNVHVCRERFNFLLCPNNQTHSIIGGNFAHGNKNMIHINGNIPQFAVLQGNPNTLTSNVNGTSFLPCNTMCNNGMNTVSMPVIHLVPNYGSAQMGCNLNSVWSPSQITPSTNWANTATTVNPLMSQNFSSQNAALMNNSTNMLQPMAYTRSHFPMNEQFTGNVSYAIELQPLSDVNSVMNPQVQQQNQMQAMKSWFAGNPQQSLVGAPQIVCFQPTQ